ncbi:hypothetical protein D1007_37996 [Hordeum vulgare]|nr:hypothetical protein D1007_37996 [Hordeum vulgare]
MVPADQAVPVEAAAEVGFTCDGDTAIEKENEVLQSAAKGNEEEDLVIDEVVAEENEVPFFGAQFQSAAKTSENKEHLFVDEVVKHNMDETAAEENEVPFLGALFQSAAKTNEIKERLVVDEVVKHNMDETAAEEENEVPFLGALFQSAAKASAAKKDLAVEEDENEVSVFVDMAVEEENEEPFLGALFQSAAKTNDHKDEPAEEEDNEMSFLGALLQSAAKTNENKDHLIIGEVQHEEPVEEEKEDDLAVDEPVEEEKEVATFGALLESAAKADEDMIVDEVQQSTEEPKNEIVEESVTINLLSQATVTVTDGEIAAKDGFTCELTDVAVEVDDGRVVTADDMPHSPAIMFKGAVQVVTIENLSQATVTDDEGSVKGLASVSVEEDAVVATMDEKVEELLVVDYLSSQAMVTDDEWAARDKCAQEVVTVDYLSQATATDDEWAVKEGTSAGDRSPVFDAAGDSSGHVISPLFAGLFEDATKFLSMDSTTLEATTVPEAASEKKATEPAVAMGKEKEVKDQGNESEALGSLSLRKLRIQLKEKAQDLEKPVERFSIHPIFEVREGKKPLDTLSLRRLRLKLKEKLNAQKNREQTRMPLGRLDENSACKSQKREHNRVPLGRLDDNSASKTQNRERSRVRLGRLDENAC